MTKRAKPALTRNEERMLTYVKKELRETSSALGDESLALFMFDVVRFARELIDDRDRSSWVFELHRIRKKEKEGQKP